ncbi:MAG: YxeA family protein [Oscillospiraceae bacterium]|nr:YxeA family protein [Oscillospiraceae bacterium]
MRKGIIIIITALIIALACACVACTSLSDSGIYYYTQIDNTKLEKNDARGGVIDFKGSLPYLYSLPAYSEEGDARVCTFGADKELKEGAFIRLRLAPLRGVISWAEVTFDELPETVKAKYPDYFSSMTAPV